MYGYKYIIVDDKSDKYNERIASRSETSTIGVI